MRGREPKLLVTRLLAIDFDSGVFEDFGYRNFEGLFLTKGIKACLIKSESALYLEQYG